MKSRSLLSVIIIASLLFSCGLSKDNRDSRKTVNGTWQLTKVDYGGEGYFKSVLFNDASSKCFVGSTWYFLANNSTGNYSIPSKEGCQAGTRNIRWSVADDASGNPSNFQFKFIDEKKKDISGGMGYIFKIISLSPQQMTLSQDVDVDGTMVAVIFSFNKTSM